MLTNEDYDNDHRTKQILFGKQKFGSHVIQKSNTREGTGITPVILKTTEMNGVKRNVVPQMIQLIIGSFYA